MRFGRTLPLFLLVFLLGCTTKLVKVDTDFRPVSPAKARLVADRIPSSVLDAVTSIVTIKLKVEQLAERVETRHYKTSYAWNGSLIWFGVAGGLAGCAFAVNDWRYESDGKVLGWSVALMLLSVFPLTGGATRAGGPPIPARSWQKDVVFNEDTSYRLPAPVASRTVNVARSDMSVAKPLQTGGHGELRIDLRNFYAQDPPGSALRLTVTQSGLSREVTIPGDYVAKARNYEDRASVLLGEAISYEKAGDSSSAFERYAQLLADYPDARAAEQAEVGLEHVKQARTDQVRRDLARVSDDKVRAALGRLGLTEYESNSLAGAVESLSSSGAASVTRKGLGLQLDESECAEEYRSLTLFQKFYAILRYANSLGGSAADALAQMLGVPWATAEKLAGLSAQKLLK